MAGFCCWDGGNDVWFCQLQVKCLCVLMFLSFPLITTEVPGPCRHSITREHLLTMRHLVGGATTPEFLNTNSDAWSEISPLLLLLQMDNQLRGGCSITYTFIERRSLVSFLINPLIHTFQELWQDLKFNCLRRSSPIRRANAAL